MNGSFPTANDEQTSAHQATPNSQISSPDSQLYYFVIKLIFPKVNKIDKLTCSPGVGLLLPHNLPENNMTFVSRLLRSATFCYSAVFKLNLCSALVFSSSRSSIKFQLYFKMYNVAIVLIKPSVYAYS